jgi:hypothetical protein
MSWSMYLVLAERSFVSCSLMMWSWLMPWNTGNPFYTSLRKLDSHIKHNSLTSTIPCLHVCRYPSQPVSVLWPAPTLMTFLMAQANYEPTFSCINTLTILKPSYSSYLPAYEDGAVFRNVGIQNSDAGELPRRKHNIHNTAKVWNQELWSMIKNHGSYCGVWSISLLPIGLGLCRKCKLCLFQILKANPQNTTLPLYSKEFYICYRCNMGKWNSEGWL